ncbi:MAG: VOC family protein [Pseudomonadota bacterium]|nr:VOC family protein [Pseudomonadota bacterium]
MQSISAANGRFVWFELMTTDLPAAIEFYRKVVGWETEDFQMGGDAPPYTMWKVPGGASVGGVFPLPEQAKQMGAPPYWLGNLCVESVDDAVAKVTKLGGQVHQPAFDVPTVGRIAIVADPTGATFALFQPAGEAPGHSGMPVPGEISWSELMTTDPEAAWSFYEGLVGWKKTDSMEMGPEHGTYQMFGRAEGGMFGGMMRSPAQMPVSAWAFYLYVAALDAAIATAEANGGKLVSGPHPIPGGDRVATLIDPQGAYFALHGK